MRALSFTLAALVATAAAGTASAQSTTATAGPFPVTGNVPALCSTGTNSSGSGSFDLGVLVNTTTGFLRTDLAAPPKVLTGAFCTSPSRITVSATPLVSVNNVAAAPAGFSRTVNFTATASGWTTPAASFATGAATNPGAAQTRGSAFTGDITVSIGTFSTNGGAALRLIADPAYLGSVTVTLAAVS